MRLLLQAGALVLLVGHAAAQGSDTCATATPITGPGTFTFSCWTATTDGAPVPTCQFSGSDQIFNDLWFRWTALDTGPHTVALCGITFGDPRVAIYAGGCGSAVLSCDDDGCTAGAPGSLNSTVRFDAVNGQSYLIRIGNTEDTPFLGADGAFVAAFTPPIQNPVNGNHYALINADLSWSEANAEAQVSLFQGVPGHLATLTSRQENDWVAANFAPNRAWIGLSQNRNSPAYSEPAGGFEWVTGEPLSFDNWGPGEPANDNLGQSEEFVEMISGGAWNDTEDNNPLTHEYIIEWEASGFLGTNYCLANPNTTGMTGSISAYGSVISSANNFTVTASDLPPHQFGIFVTSLNQGFLANAGGTSNGNICLGSNVGRFFMPDQILSSGTTGEYSLQLPLTAFPQGSGFAAVMPGDTWNFQSWHRDSAGQGSNLTDGLEVTFQ